MSVSPSPRIMRCAPRRRRSFTARTTTHRSATAAMPAATRATIPCVEFRSSTGARVARSAGEYDRELALVVVGDLLAGHRLDVHGDRDVLAGRRLRCERDAHGLQLAGADVGDRLLGLDRVRAGPDRDGHAHVGLGALALVHDLAVERDVNG